MAGDTRKWWAPIAACPTCNEDADLCPHDQEHTMTSPTQRRHEEIIGRLDALIDAVRSTTARDNLHRLLAEESAAERPNGGLVDVTVEPPCGSQVTDVNGDVWHRRDDIVWRLVAYRDKSGSFGGAPWGHVRQFAPLRLTTDADRERVGLPVDTAPDVDPDDTEAYLTGKRAPDQTEQLAARVLDLEADVERLTRERDEARRDVRTAERQTTEQQARHEALRADVEAMRKDAEGFSVADEIDRRILARDDERGRDA